MLTKSCKKVAINFCCKNCDYNTSRKSSYEKHVLSTKHNLLTNVNEKLQESCKIISTFTCTKCSKVYKSRVGLWKHNKLCMDNQEFLQFQNNPTNPSLLLEVLKQNQEFKDLIVEQNKQNQQLTKQVLELSKETKSITNNINNNKFNMNFFLNEQCKDALNITDFVSSLTLKLTELEQVGQLGYVEGISKIFIRGLKELDIYKRPIHCSDIKREVLYVKDQDSWEKENEEKQRIQRAIQKIAHKNIQQIPIWSEKYPQCKDSTNKKNDEYLQIINESMGGGNALQREEYMQKIIKNVAKEVVIEK
jgi:hypothetical protein